MPFLSSADYEALRDLRSQVYDFQTGSMSATVTYWLYILQKKNLQALVSQLHLALLWDFMRLITDTEKLFHCHFNSCLEGHKANIASNCLNLLQCFCHCESEVTSARMEVNSHEAHLNYLRCPFARLIKHTFWRTSWPAGTEIALWYRWAKQAE